jgi:NADH-quinone oxidoreductase subunit N
MTSLLQTVDAVAVLPEIVLAVLAAALLMVGAFAKSEPYKLVQWLAIGAIALAVLLVVFATGEGRVMSFAGSFIVDDFARVMKVLALFGAAVALLLSGNYLARVKMAKFEYAILVLLAAVGMMMMISANDLISLYMGLELQSLSLYVVAAINRDDTKSSEAGLKYFVLGALSSGMLLYGASLVYGFTGTTQFAGIAEALKANGSSLGIVFGLVFVLAGLAFKVSAVPFHMWTPDVYEGAPTPVTAFFASAPKVAAIALMIRVLTGPFNSIINDWQQIIVVISVLSMALGSFAAIGQTNIKRLLAYSSIGHMGFALVGLAAGTQDGVSGVVIYMLIYVLTTLGVFACVLAMRRAGLQVENISDLSGLGMTNKALAFVLSMLMFSLAGIPPLAGFFAKYFVFSAAWQAGLWQLLILGVLSSVVGAYYYLRIVKIIYFDEPKPAFDSMDTEVKWVAYLSGAFALLFVPFASPLITVATAAAKSLF